MLFKAPLKITSSLLAILLVAVVWNISEKHYVYTEIEIPDAEEFDMSSGLQLEIKTDETLFVGATTNEEGLDFNNDGQADIIIADNNNLSVYTNARNTEDFVRGPFLAEGTVASLESGFSFLMGQDLGNDQDLDLILVANPTFEYAKAENIATISAVGTDFIEDEDAIWGPGELIDLELRPDAEKEQSYKIIYNGIAGERGHDSPFIQVDLSEEGAADTFAALALEGKKYSYQTWTQKESTAPKLQVFLNGGNADFIEPKNCPAEMSLPAGTAIMRMVAGRFNNDDALDIALFVSTGTTGTVSEYTWEEGAHGTSASFSKWKAVPSAFARGYEDDENRFRPPFRATFRIKDPAADFAALAGQQNLYIVPDINNTYTFPLVSVGTDNGIQYIEGEVELNNISSLTAGTTFMDTLSLAGRSYAIRIGEADPIFLKGLEQEGCFQLVESISGEVFEADYRSTVEEPTTHRTFFTDPSQNFLPEDSLVGWSVNFFRKGETESDQSYEIEHNTQTTIYLFPEAGRVPIEDLINDGNPFLYVLEPPGVQDPSQRFAYSENLLEEDKLSSFDLPADYVRRMKNLETIETPVRAAFADFDADGDLDFVYANGNLFYKENQA
ncbi:MAG: VCBS repeat-containing protein [Candidatus Gracilibacteria bacterium]|nr:VCBS repeat-containing protein [Candidatus Gracilibacteria bacterium]